MTDSTNIERLTAQCDQIRARFAGIGEFRRSSLCQTYRKCGKSYCHCAKPNDPGHGPSWIPTYSINSKAVSRGIPSAALEQTRDQVQEYQRFCELVNQLVEAISCAMLGSKPIERLKRASYHLREVAAICCFT